MTHTLHRPALSPVCWLWGQSRPGERLPRSGEKPDCCNAGLQHAEARDSLNTLRCTGRPHATQRQPAPLPGVRGGGALRCPPQNNCCKCGQISRSTDHTSNICEHRKCIRDRNTASSHPRHNRARNIFTVNKQAAPFKQHRTKTRTSRYSSQYAPFSLPK